MTAPTTLAGTTVFLTGATGFLGYAVARALLDAGAEVRALVRSGGLPPGLPDARVSVVRGDLFDRDVLVTALRGCACVFHVAADVRMSKDAWAAVHRTNVEGTRVLLEAAQRASVPRFVFTSSGSTLGKPLDATSGPIVTVDERSAYNFAPLGWVYPHTKWLAEELVLAANGATFSTVVTHPTAIFGPWDWKHNLLPLFRAPHGALGLVTTGGARTVCDVRDVADGHLRAATRGTGGARYALAGEPVTVRALQSMIAEAVGGRPPRIELPPGLVHRVGRFSDAIGTLRGTPALFTEEMALQSCLRVVVSSEKAIRELGYHNRPARESIADTAAWYVQEGLLPAR